MARQELDKTFRSVQKALRQADTGGSATATQRAMRAMIRGFGGAATSAERLTGNHDSTRGFVRVDPPGRDGGLKDVKLMIAAAQDVKLRLSSAEALRSKLEESIARGWQDKDWSCFTDIDRG